MIKCSQLIIVKKSGFRLMKPIGLTISHTLFANCTLQFPTEHLLQEDGAGGDRYHC